MHLHEIHEGDWRVFVGALDAPRGTGYIAALIVNRVGDPSGCAAKRAVSRQTEAFRDDSLACGYRWRTAEEALQYATARGRDLIRSRLK